MNIYNFEATINRVLCSNSNNTYKLITFNCPNNLIIKKNSPLVVNIKVEFVIEKYFLFLKHPYF